MKVLLLLDFLFIQICTLMGTDFCVPVPSHLLSQVRQDALTELGSAFLNFLVRFIECSDFAHTDVKICCSDCL